MRAYAAAVITSARLARSAAIASTLAARVVPMPEWPGGALRAWRQPRLRPRRAEAEHRAGHAAGDRPCRAPRHPAQAVRRAHSRRAAADACGFRRVSSSVPWRRDQPAQLVPETGLRAAPCRCWSSPARPARRPRRPAPAPLERGKVVELDHHAWCAVRSCTRPIRLARGTAVPPPGRRTHRRPCRGSSRRTPASSRAR